MSDLKKQKLINVLETLKKPSIKAVKSPKQEAQKVYKKISVVKKSGTKKLTPWHLLVKKICNENKCNVKDAISHIKKNNLY